MEWSTEKDGEVKPRLQVVVAALQTSLKLRTWDMSVEASLGSLSVLDYYHNTGKLTVGQMVSRMHC